MKKDPKTVDATEWTFAKETVVLDARIAREPVAKVEVQAVQVGPAVFLACPAEYFCQFGLDIKAAVKFPFAFPVSLANDAIGYVPTEEALGPARGRLRDAADQLQQPRAGRGPQDRRTRSSSSPRAQARRGAEGPPLPPFRGQPWSYGNLPPELD